MATDQFPKEDLRVLTPEAFDFVLNNELKRAARSQNFLTLLLMQASISGAPNGGNGDRDRLVRHLAGLVSREVRETDLLSETEKGRLSIVLLDADLQNSLLVLERLMSRFQHYEFGKKVDIEVGAACCPTHGADADSLRRAAEAQPVWPRHEDEEGHGPASSAS